jgi:multidrug efflux pump subunit AcrA (membrane-fusion protein)
MRARASVKPSKPASAMGLVVGIVFVGIGLTMAIPRAGAFGVFWTLIAVAITGYNALNLFSEEGVATEVVDFETSPGPTTASGVLTPEQRLASLDGLRQQGLITEQEYAEQRRRILESI